MDSERMLMSVRRFSGRAAMKALLATLFLLVAVAGVRAEGGRRVTNDEYRFSLRFPEGRTPCTSLSWTHPHGFYVRLDQKDCHDPRDGPGISVTADGNVLFKSSLGDVLREVCNRDRLSAASMRKLQLEFPDRPSAACRLNDADGTVRIYVVTQAGEWPRPHEPPELSAPYINYTAFLGTTSRRFDADLKVFRAVLHSIHIDYPK